MSHRFSQLKYITDYIISEYSHYVEQMGDMMIFKNIVVDISKFSHIIGRMENYLVREDSENFELMEEYLKREFEASNYVWSDFLKFIEFNQVEDTNDNTEEE